MNGAVLVAVAAAIGNFLQGWDNATIAGTSFMFILQPTYFSACVSECLNQIFKFKMIHGLHIVFLD